MDTTSAAGTAASIAASEINLPTRRAEKLTEEEQDLNDEKLVTVAERSTEVAAKILVTVLADEGIKAVATGGWTAGFRAEAPGVVRVQTLENDAERAKKIISELKPES